MPFINWIVAPIMALAAIIAAWFVATDSANFGVVQMAIAVLLMTTVVAIATFWRTLADWLGIRPKHRPPPSTPDGSSS